MFYRRDGEQKSEFQKLRLVFCDKLQSAIEKSLVVASPIDLVVGRAHTSGQRCSSIEVSIQTNESRTYLIPQPCMTVL